MRPPPSWATVVADLAGLASGEAPAWLRADTRAAAKRLVRLVARDARRVVDAATSRTEAAKALGVARATLFLWIAPSGWLQRPSEEIDEES